MEKNNLHLIEADLESQAWIERYAEIQNLSIQETLIALLKAGRMSLEKQRLQKTDFKNQEPELSPRLKFGIQAAVECLAILRKVHLPDLASQNKLSLEVKRLIEEAICQKAKAG